MAVDNQWLIDILQQGSNTNAGNEAYQRVQEKIREQMTKQQYIVPWGETIGIDPGLPPGEWKLVERQRAIQETRPRTDPYREKFLMAETKIKELTEILERLKKEPGLLVTIQKMSKDKKYAYVKKGDQEIRIEACKNLDIGHEVILNAKSMQIIEHLGLPPLEASRFSLDTLPDVSWEDIAGLEQPKKDFQEAIELPFKNKTIYAHYGQKQIKGILLSGPPGCGKTMLGKAAAYSLAKLHGKENTKTGFLYVKGPEILDCYVGATEEAIRNMFSDARRHFLEHNYPAVIFIDEGDAILSARGTHIIGIGNTIVPMFLTEMDGLIENTALVIIATNRPDALDSAIVRDGRIDRKIIVPRPDERQAKIILDLSLKKVPLAEGLEIAQVVEAAVEQIWSSDTLVDKGIYLRDIVNGAMLVNCVNIAISFAMHRDIEANAKTKKQCSGVQLDDIKQAIHRLQKENHGIRHQT